MNRTCDDVEPSRLRLLLEEGLPGPEKGRLESHLETCEACRDALEDLAGEPGWWEDARRFVPRDLAPPTGPTEDDGPGGDRKPGPRRQDGPTDGGDIWLDFLAPSDDPEALGRLGGYEVLGVLGRGGMGIVFKAYDPALDRMVALKVLSPALAASGAARHRFAREARAAAAVVHEHVVAIHGVSTWRGLPYLVMQYVPGRSLQDRIDQDGPLELEEVLRIGVQAASGLAAAHAHGLVHRDVKPSNILLEDGLERVKITDFGLARAADDASLTHSGVLAGTPQYMAPEQAQGEGIDHRADLFSLGSVLYAMCAGRPPFRARTTVAVIRRVCDEQPRPLREINPDVPSWLAAIIAKLHAKDPARRFASATELAEVLSARLAQLRQPDDKPVAALTRRADRWNRWLPIAAGFFVVVAVVSSTHAGGFSQIRAFLGTIFRIKTPEGTLVIDVDDPEVKVRVDGSEVVVTGTGPQEFRYRPGPHRVVGIRDGRPVLDKVVTIERGGKEIVSISQEGDSAPGVRAEDRPRIEPPAPRAAVPSMAPRARAGGGLQPVPEPNPHLLQQRIRRLEDQLARMQGAPAANRTPVPMPPGVVIVGGPPPAPAAPAPEGLPSPPGNPGATPALEVAPPAAPAIPAPPAPPGPGAAPEVAPPAAPPAVPVPPAAPDAAPAAEPAPVPAPAVPVPPAAPGGAAAEVAPVPAPAAVPAPPTAPGDAPAVEVSPPAAPPGAPSEPAAPGEVPPVPPSTPELPPTPARAPTPAAAAPAPPPDAEPFARLLEVHPVGDDSPAFDYPNGAIRAVAYSPEIHDLAMVTSDGALAVWSRSPLGVRAKFLLRQEPVTKAAFSPDGKMVAACDAWKTVHPGDSVKVWGVGDRVHAGGDPKARFAWSFRSPLGLAFSPDGKALAVAGVGESIHLFDLSTGRRRARYETEGERICVLAFTPDGRTLASVGGDNAIRFRAVDTGVQTRVPITPRGSPANCLAFSHDGRTLAFPVTPPDKKPLFLQGDIFESIDQHQRWIVLLPTDGVSMKSGRQLTSSRYAIRALAFSPDGGILASAGGSEEEEEGEVSLWDASTGERLAYLQGHRRTVTCLAFSPDGKTLVTAGGWNNGPGEVKLWDLHSLHVRELSRKD